MNAWVKIHSILTAIEVVTRSIQMSELKYFEEVILLLFELPCDRYLAFRYVATEIIENISYILAEKSSHGLFLIDETNKFIQFITPGIKSKMTSEISSRCFMNLCKHTKNFLYVYVTEIIEQIIPKTVKDWRCDKTS